MNEAAGLTSVNVGGFHGSVLDMALAAGPMVQFVLVLLLFFSVVSWAIILMKYRILGRVKKENRMFLEAYMRINKLSDVFPESKKFSNSTLAEVFRAGYTELVKTAGGRRESLPDEKIPLDSPGLELRGIDNVERALNRACEVESARLSSALGFLATTGSASPFIGLFGTVWGIMSAFKGIGIRGTASLAVVAPGISEALIATAAGLAAAIPAVIFYNYYVNRVRVISVESDNFASEFLNIVERYYVKNVKT
ncbi:MAG: MotA/TolQ/ExbB proton channel family protein [Deltaproteobacteria bacterium]|nr:MotA/TolQ/ExbB proton channel family protein [Deltaproteobacteria bacterium]